MILSEIYYLAVACHTCHILVKERSVTRCKVRPPVYVFWSLHSVDEIQEHCYQMVAAPFMICPFYDYTQSTCCETITQLVITSGRLLLVLCSIAYEFMINLLKYKLESRTFLCRICNLGKPSLNNLGIRSM